MVSRRHQTQAQPAQSLMVRLCKAQVAMGGVLIMNEHLPWVAGSRLNGFASCFFETMPLAMNPGRSSCT